MCIEGSYLYLCWSDMAHGSPTSSAVRLVTHGAEYPPCLRDFYSVCLIYLGFIHCSLLTNSCAERGIVNDRLAISQRGSHRERDQGRGHRFDILCRFSIIDNVSHIMYFDGELFDTVHSRLVVEIHLASAPLRWGTRATRRRLFGRASLRSGRARITIRFKRRPSPFQSVSAMLPTTAFPSGALLS